MASKRSKEDLALQRKLDDMLSQAIADVKTLGYDVFKIEPHVRMTNNRTRLGSAQVTNGAGMDPFVRKNLKQEVWTKDPVFRVSISRLECDTDEDIRNVLYHEVIHCVPGCCNHGKRWKSVAAAVNRAYGTNVETTKKSIPGTSRKAPSAPGRRKSNNKNHVVIHDAVDKLALRKELEAHVGEQFKMRNKTYTFAGFNGRPKRCCDLVDMKGNTYICNAMTCAYGLGIIS